MALERLTKDNFVDHPPFFPVYDYWYNVMADAVDALTAVEGAMDGSTLTMTSTDAGATAAPEICLYRNSASPAALDVLGQITFDGEDSVGNQEEYARIQVAIVDPTATTEDGIFQVYTKHGGDNSTYPQLQVSDTSVNAIRTDNGAEGATLQMSHISESPAAADAVGMVKFIGTDSGGASQEYAQIAGTIVDTTADAEYGSIEMKVVVDSVVTKVAEFTKNGLVIAAAGGYHAMAISCAAQVENNLCTVTSTTAVTTSAIMKAFTVSFTATGASAINMLEAASFTLTSAVKMGVWANALSAKIDMSTTGYVTGLAGVICAELSMPSTAPAGGSGTYTCFEAEINMASATTVPVSAIAVNAWGTQVASFDDYGFLFDIAGVSMDVAHFFQANNNTASHALRIRVNGTPYYILLSETSD